MDFKTSPLYWNFNLLLLWLDLSLVIYFVAKELFERMRENKKLLLFLGIIPLIILLPLGPKYFSNSFVHESLALELAKNPVANSHCLWYGEGCNLMSFASWTSAYHILLSKFIGLGIFGITLLNAILIFLFFFFGYLTIEQLTNKQKSWMYLPLIIFPQMIVLASTPNLDILSLSLGVVFLYFSLRKRIWEAVSIAAYLIHIRPETFIYLFIMGAPLLKDLIKRPKLAAFFGVNLLLKVVEYMKGTEFITEWTLNWGVRSQMLSNLGPGFKFIFNIMSFNILFSALVVIGSIALFKKRKIGLAILPLFSIFAYTTHPYRIFGTGIGVDRYILGWAFASLPAFYEGLKNQKFHKLLLILAIVPLINLDFSESWSYETRVVAEKHLDDLVHISNNNSLPLVSYFPFIFEGKAEAVFIMDDFPYPPGQYLEFQSRNASFWKNTTYIGHIENELFLFVLTHN
ncbi:MAG: hypothetical protein GOV00_01710 [Candidatus Altiarchaeota archaeon]|nr:hypothetical protein [Candidatus Altiarchaeota archaeon]